MADSDLATRWRRHWNAVDWADAAASLFDRLMDAYGAPARVYHGCAHLVHVFAELERVEAALEDPARAWMAGWFHDAIYDTTRPDNEERSALWAEEALGALGAPADFTARVAALIRATADHGGGGDDLTDALFLDADMAILGAPAHAYDAYAAGVRREYAWVDDALWAQGRGGFLDKQLTRARVFHTDAFETPYGAQARDNMARERAALAPPS